MFLVVVHDVSITPAVSTTAKFFFIVVLLLVLCFCYFVLEMFVSIGFMSKAVM